MRKTPPRVLRIFDERLLFAKVGHSPFAAAFRKCKRKPPYERTLNSSLAESGECFEEVFGHLAKKLSLRIEHEDARHGG